MIHHVRTLTPEQWAEAKRKGTGPFRKPVGGRPTPGSNVRPNAALALAQHLGVPVGIIVYSSDDAEQIAS